MRRGEVWLVEFATPAETGEPANTRPALIVSADRFNRTRSPTVVLVPLTTAARGHPLHVEIDAPGLAATSFAQTELVGVVSRRRVVRHLADVDQLVMAEISVLLTTLLEL